jgi:hypothetical protein
LIFTFDYRQSYNDSEIAIFWKEATTGTCQSVFYKLICINKRIDMFTLEVLLFQRFTMSSCHTLSIFLSVLQSSAPPSAPSLLFPLSGSRNEQDADLENLFGVSGGWAGLHSGGRAPGGGRFCGRQAVGAGWVLRQEGWDLVRVTQPVKQFSLMLSFQLYSPPLTLDF